MSVHDSNLDVRHKTGRVLTITVDEQTEYLRNGNPGSTQLLNPGRRVRIEIESNAGAPRARRVYIFGGGTRQARP